MQESDLIAVSLMKVDVQLKLLSLCLSPPMEQASPGILHTSGMSLSVVDKNTRKSSKLTSIDVTNWTETILAHIAMP